MSSGRRASWSWPSSGRGKSGIRGCAKGRRREGAADILLVLKARGVAVPKEIEQRIAACADPAVLSRWLERAVTAESAAEVVEPKGAC